MKLNKNYIYNFAGMEDEFEELSASNMCAIKRTNTGKKAIKTEAQKAKASARAERNAEAKAHTQGRNAQRRYKR